MDWRERYERAAARYAAGETRELDERQLVQLANSAWAAGLSLLMDGRPRGSCGVAAAVGGAVSRELGRGRRAGCVGPADRRDEGAAHRGRRRDAARREWALDAGRGGGGVADRPLRGCARAARPRAETRRRQLSRDARATAFRATSPTRSRALARRDADAYRAAVASVRRSFEEREAFLEDVPVPDTALALDALAAARARLELRGRGAVEDRARRPLGARARLPGVSRDGSPANARATASALSSPATRKSSSRVLQRRGSVSVIRSTNGS